jgi:hypothetical protein
MTASTCRAGACPPLFAALLLSACPVPETPPAPPPITVPDVFCPGGPSCSETLVDDVLLAGAAKRDITPTRFEVARPSHLNVDRPNYCAPEAPEQRCGELRDEHAFDCGHDGLCPGDEGYAGPDEDGSEFDGDDRADWFFDCGLDRLCPGDDGYPGPDEGEGDGRFQGLWLSGYGNNRPALGVKDALSVRAVVFRQGDSTIALVTVDAVGLFFDEQERMKQKLETLRPGQVDALFVQASHTHEAPDTMGQWGYVDPFTGLQIGHGRSDEHMENIRSQGAAAVAEALDNLVPVEVRVGKINAGVEGLVRDGRDPKIYNDALTVISLENQSSGAVVATLLNWGNHPESLDSRNNYISADYLHALREALENGLPATERFPARPARGGVGIYLQGAVGGIMGPNGFPIVGRDGTVHENDRKTWARTDAYGELLAELGFQALERAELLARTPLRFSAIRYRAPVENQVFHVGLFNGWFDRALHEFNRDGTIGPGNFPVLETAVGLLFIGDIGFVTAPGELFPETFVGFGDQGFGPQISPDNPNPPDLSKSPASPSLSELLGVRFPIPLGLCQDEIGYLVPPYDFKLADTGAYIDEAPGDHYEETNSIGPEAVPYMLQHHDVLFAFERARAE